MSDLIKVCPHCDTPNVEKQTRRGGYYCKGCYSHIPEDEIVERKLKNTQNSESGRRSSESVRALLDADPDDALP